jgi:hypothetical protein
MLLDMPDRFRRFWSDVLVFANLRPPHGHMKMLRGEMSDREDARLVRATDTTKRQDDERRKRVNAT